MVASNLHQLVFQTAKEILADGQYPTIDLICQKLGITPTDIETVLSDESEEKPSAQPETNSKDNEMLEALNLLARLSLSQEKQAEISNNDHNNSDYIADTPMLEEEEDLPDHVAQMAARADRKAQYMAAAEFVLTQKLYRYYRQTEHFSQSELKKQVELAMEETDKAWEDDIANFSPAAILKKYGK